MKVADDIETQEQPEAAASGDSVAVVEAADLSVAPEAKDDASIDRQQPETSTDDKGPGLGESIHAPSNVEDKGIPVRLLAPQIELSHSDTPLHFLALSGGQANGPERIGSDIPSGDTIHRYFSIRSGDGKQATKPQAL